MSRNTYFAFGLSAALTLGCVSCSKGPGGMSDNSVTPAKMRRIGTVPERFQSYNVEMIEVTGGRFWKPYKDIGAILDAQKPASQPGDTPAGMNPGLYEYRPPIDLSDRRLRQLALALGPAYVRVSGTWANTTYFHDSDKPAPKTPPKGFNGILTREQWEGVVDFAHDVNAHIVTSFATSPGVRDKAGVWTPKQARQFLAYNESIGGRIAAAEYMNEPTFAAMGGAPKGYDAAAFARDIAVFRPFLKQASPETILLGPGGVGEGVSLVPQSLAANTIPSEGILKATGPVFDAFSYHFYGAISRRCASMNAAATISPANALSDDWLSRTERVESFYADLRDRYEPGKPMWVTETGDAACGGNPWASTFLDSFRYVNQLGSLARRGVQVVAHNTLAASDYGLLDQNTLEPRPDYWTALLWRKFMGTTVLDPGASPNGDIRLYAHCLRGTPGGVALLLINTSRSASHALEIAAQSDRYTLTAQDLNANIVQLNGSDLKLGEEAALPQLTGTPASAGELTLPSASITFLAIANANNANCR